MSAPVGLLVGLLACGAPRSELPSTEPVAVRVTLDGPVKSGGGAIEVQAWYDPNGDLDLPEPSAQGLTFSADGPPRTERVGDRDAVKQRYVFRGPAGNYEVPPLVATWTDRAGATTSVSSDALFFDLDAPPPVAAELTDIVEPPVLLRVPWVPIVTVTALAGMAVAFALTRKRAPRVDASRPLPPDVACLRAWDEIRRDVSLTIDDKAAALSVLFRTYVEQVLGFEASARTTTEILEHLRGLTHLPEGNVTRAQRILRATDRIKFARAKPAEDWLAELDADLRAFVASTRPSAFTDREAVSTPSPPSEGAA